MQDLLAQRDDPAAAEAIDYFCYRVRAHLAMLTAALEGLDRVVFTGGIGANASAIRKEICDGLGYLGIAVDPKRNADGAGIVSAESSPVIVEARRTDEELMIARHTRQLVPAVSSVARTEP
jgi:acetate kinase